MKKHPKVPFVLQMQDYQYAARLVTVICVSIQQALLATPVSYKLSCMEV